MNVVQENKLENFKKQGKTREKELKYSMNLYSDYQSLIKPKESNLDYLCPQISQRTPVQNLLGPKQSYAKYRLASMKLLKTTDTRIKRAKEYLKIAKNLSTRYF